MKQRILAAVGAALCAITLFAAGIAPAHAYAPPSGEGDVSIQEYEQTRIYYRWLNGVRQMRIWSVTKCKWLTDWFDCP